jgi:hypothetical protein
METAGHGTQPSDDCESPACVNVPHTGPQDNLQAENPHKVITVTFSFTFLFPKLSRQLA